MFIIKLIIYLNLISHIISQNEYHLSKSHEDSDTIIEPLKLVLRSTDTEGIFYCTSRVESKKQGSKLTASIEKPILTSPKFLLETKQINTTKIRIRIKPNGYIGVNRIICHWNDNLTFGQTADLTIGENPGVIQLKERCLAYDRRYVQCIFRAPIIARAFQNGFAQLYTFSEINLESISYRPSPELVKITNKSELIFHFEPRERNIIPKRVLMNVSMTLSGFGSSVYRFNIEPMHTTKVDFLIDDISSKQFTIRINHNNTGTISQRLCSGHISQVDDQNILTADQDIIETSDQQILINRLRPSTQYKICLRCFYERTDRSFKDEKCDRIKTTKSKYTTWIILVVIVLGVIVLGLISIVLFRRIRRSCDTSHSLRCHSIITKSSDSEILDVSSSMKEMQDSSATDLPPIRYGAEPGEENPFIENNDTTVDVVNFSLHNRTYQTLDNVMDILTDKDKVSADTYDVSRQQKS